MPTFLTTLKSRTALTAGALCVMTSNATADIQQLDDVIITFSLCVGNDCVNGENFGFDTIRMKENNIRLHFNDTSTTASFPGNDWRIVANDADNGGSNYLAIEDSTAGRIPFRVEGGAPANALHVDASGNIGLGTASPVVGMHVVDGNTPTLRLEQDGSSGFTPQTYDIASNETNFFIRDVTNSSRLFFRAQPGAPENSIYIRNSGNIGFGTATPDAGLHITDSNRTTPGILVEETGSTANILAQFKNDNQIAIMQLTSSDHSWNFQNRGATTRDLRITNGSSTGAAGAEFTLTETGDLTLTGSITTGGTQCGTGCDRVFEADYDLMSIEEHAGLMWENSYLPNVGPTLEDAPFNLTEKVGRMLNELEHAHIYISELHSRIELLEESAALTK
ncbi:MAG: hypothetical protein ABJI43_21420 [Roseobacter sp.]